MLVDTFANHVLFETIVLERREQEDAMSEAPEKVARPNLPVRKRHFRFPRSMKRSLVFFDLGRLNNEYLLTNDAGGKECTRDGFFIRCRTVKYPPTIPVILSFSSVDLFETIF